MPSNIPQIPTITGHKDSAKGPLGAGGGGGGAREESWLLTFLGSSVVYGLYKREKVSGRPGLNQGLGL